MKGVSGASDGDETHWSTCNEDTVGRTIIPLQLSSDHPNYPGLGDYILSSDMVVVSPGVPLESHGLSFLLQSGKRILSKLDFAAEILPRSIKILAATGTNGKSTIATFSGQMLSHLGIEVIVEGNLGIPL